MKPWIAGVRAMTRMAVAAVALGFVSCMCNPEGRDCDIRMGD